jgi:hypothetical protein
VTNSLYTITVDDGNIVLNVLATFLETSTIPNIRTMVQDLAYDLILNFYTAASFRVTTSNGTRSIYTIDFDNALSMVKDGKSDLLNEVIGKISVDGVNALANDLIATLTDFKTLGTASGTEYTIASYTLEQATWDVNLSVDKVDPENTESDYYVNVQITPKTKTTQMTDDETGETTETKTCDWSSRKFTVQVVDPDENGTNMAELAALSNSLNDIVTIDAAELSVTGISYENGDLQVTGDSTKYKDGRLATVKVTVNLAKDANYPQILAVVIADNAKNISKDSKDALVAAIKGYRETGDISALKTAIEGVTSAELFSALGNAKGKTFSKMLENLGLTDSNSNAEAMENLEKTYDKMLNVLYVLMSKLGLEGSGATLGSKKMQNAPGTYQVSGMKKSICAELTIKLFTNGSVSAVDEKGNVKYDGEDLTAALTAVAESGGVVKVTTGEKTLKSNVTVTGEVSISGASNIKFGNGYYIYLGKSDATITADGALGYKASNGVFMSGVKLADSMDSTVYELPEPDGAGGSYVYALNVKMPTVEPTVNKGSGSIIKGYSVEESTVQESEHKEQVEGQIFLDVDPSNGITVRQLDALAFEVEAQGSTMTIVDKDGKPLGKDAKLGTGAQITIKATNTAEDPADTTQTITKEKTATYTIIIMGDLDGDGKSGAFDASLLLQYSVGKRTLSDAQQQAADIDGNGGGPYAFDASKILRKSVYEWNDGTYKTALK